MWHSKKCNIPMYDNWKRQIYNQQCELHRIMHLEKNIFKKKQCTTRMRGDLWKHEICKYSSNNFRTCVLIKVVIYKSRGEISMEQNMRSWLIYGCGQC